MPETESIIFRAATPADRAAILAVSARFPNDWIPYIIDEGLADRPGGFFVGEVGGRVAAICHASIRGTDAWLGAMRVDPDYQGRGLATGLTRHILDALPGLGCRVARLSTAVTNAPVHHFIGGNLGFTALGRWVVFDDATDLQPWPASPAAPTTPAAPAVPSTSSAPPAPCIHQDRIRAAGPGDLEAVWSFLEARRLEGDLRPAGVIPPYGDAWSLVTLTRASLAPYLEGGASFIAHRGPGTGGIAAVALGSHHPHATWDGVERGFALLAFLVAPAGMGASLLAAYLAEASRHEGIRTLSLSLPEPEWQKLRPLVKPGWPAEEPSIEAVTYEKRLDP